MKTRLTDSVKRVWCVKNSTLLFIKRREGVCAGEPSGFPCASSVQRTRINPPVGGGRQKVRRLPDFFDSLNALD